MSPPQKTHASVKDTLQAATTRLQVALKLERQEARLEAQILAAHALATHRAWLVAHDQDVLTPAQADAVEALVARREQGEPVAYILGEKEFYGRLFKVTPDVLIPRPETELLVEAALDRLPKNQPASILDIGTGTGCIAISLALERPDCTITAIDISAAALSIAASNAKRLDAHVRFKHSDLFTDLKNEQFNLIVSNPPYIALNDPHLTQGDVRYEPTLALSSGMEGLDTLLSLIQSAHTHLTRSGWLLMEHGWDQADKVRKHMANCNYMNIAHINDLAGHRRITLGQWPLNTTN
jgi:release factor glutamine methyltransferase